jgi:hypothetical protein
MSDILRLREALQSSWPREEIDLEAVARLIGGVEDRPLTAADVLRDDIVVLRNAERDGTSLAPGYAGLLADRIDDVMQHMARAQRGYDHYMDEWSEVCNENQELLNRIAALSLDRIPPGWQIARLAGGSIVLEPPKPGSDGRVVDPDSRSPGDRLLYSLANALLHVVGPNV